MTMEEKYFVEVSPEKMILKKISGDKSEEFEVPRKYLRAVYDAIWELAKLKKGESKKLELIPKEEKGESAPPPSSYLDRLIRTTRRML
jgi:hypothetical protein